MLVHEFLARVSKSDESVEANLSTIFPSVCGTKQYQFHQSTELKCMLREYASLTPFITFSCAECNSEHIDRHLRKVNDNRLAILYRIFVLKILFLCPENSLQLFLILLNGSVLGVLIKVHL